MVGEGRGEGVPRASSHLLLPGVDSRPGNNGNTMPAETHSSALGKPTFKH